MTQNSMSDYNKKIAETIIEQLKKGTAPWQLPWSSGPLHIPHNPISGTRYRGGNTIALMSEAIERGYDDSRWMTYEQAKSIGTQVRRGEKGTVLRFYKFTEDRPALDRDGVPIKDEQGKIKKEQLQLSSPKVISFVVFNAAQIEGLEPEEKAQIEPRQEFQINARAEAILKASGANISLGGDRAYYRPLTDEIRLPSQEQFSSPEAFYATAMHELGHWSGAPSRLSRDIAHPFGSTGYAKEELRAEIFSMMLSAETGIKHDPAQHTAYVDSWIKVLKDDHREIFRAAADAEKMLDYVLNIEKNIEQSLEAEKEKTTTLNIGATEPMRIEQVQILTLVKPEDKNEEECIEKTYLCVPYKDRFTAKKLGAKWDKEELLWYVPKEYDMTPFKQWALPTRASDRMSPVDEFAASMKSAGIVVDGHPIMDGKIHRARVEGGSEQSTDGAYIGYLDGHPSGYIQNFKTGYRSTWKAKGYSLTEEEKKKLHKEAAITLKNRQKERNMAYEQAADSTKTFLIQQPSATDQHPYLERKGIHSHGAKIETESNSLLIPAYDVDGKIWSYQKIDETGEKRFASGGKLAGCMCITGGDGNQAEDLKRLLSGREILIAEGFATAATLSEITGSPVVAAFSANNLAEVAKAIHKKAPHSKIIVCGDDDRSVELKTGVNPGREKAEATAKTVGGEAIFPIFPFGNVKLTDFNDLRSLIGEDAKYQVESLIELAQTKSQSTQKELGFRKEKSTNREMML